MSSMYFSIAMVILLVNVCIVETQGFFEKPNYTSEFNNEDGQLNRQREKRDTSISALEYIVVVEVNVSQLILLQLLKSSLHSISFQLDNSTTVTAVEISTVCQYNNTGYQCRCEDEYVWPCEKCTEYGHCDDINTTCGCINAVPSDGEFCQPVTKLTNTTTCPTTSLPTEYVVDFDVALSDYSMVPFLRELLMNFTVPLILDGGVNITEISITTVCTLNGSQYACRCEDQYAWSYNTCRTYGMCDNSMAGTCGCINGVPEDELCQRDVDECDSAPSICGPYSTCNNTVGGYNCSCSSGFTAANPDPSITNPCKDVDECGSAPSICGPYSTCNNTVGGYNCSCSSGLTAVNPDLSPSITNPCKDIDECVTVSAICGPYSTCNNTVGGYNCSCSSGFTARNPDLNPSITNPCKDVDECGSAPSICGPYSTCNNTVGGYNCSCSSGFTAVNPDPSITNPCKDIDECVTVSAICGPYSTCNNTVGGYNCSCSSGFTARNPDLNPSITNPCKDVDECRDVDSYCGQNTNCTNTVGGYDCSCLSGFTTKNSSLSVSTNNPCILLPGIPVNLSLTLNEKFDILLTNPNSAKYIQYRKSIEKSINDAYLKVAGYTAGSVKVSRFRPGSVIADFTIVTTEDKLNFGLANSELTSALIVSGFSVNKSAFAESNECNLTQSSGKIYPQQDLLLNCEPPAGSKGDVKWTAAGNDPLSSPDKYEVLNNNLTLKLKSVNSDYNGIYECITTKNSLPNIQWQRIVVQPNPNIQVGSDKVFNCTQLTVPLQCCAHNSYTIEWIQDSSTGTLTPPGSGCITYYYTIQKQYCEAGDLSVTFTCQLTGVGLENFQYNSKNITIKAIKKESGCSDNIFGVGTVNQTATGNCDTGMVGIQWATCSPNGNWSRTANNCTLRVIQDLTDKAENLDVTEVSHFTANLSNVVEQNSKNITNASATIVKIVDLLNTIATVSQSITVTKDVMKDFLKTVDIIVSNDTHGQWQELNKDVGNRNASSALLQSIEKIGDSLADEPLSFATANIQLNRTNFTNSFNGVFGQNSTTQINITGSNISSSITVIVFSALYNVLPVRNATHNESVLTDAKINSNVVMIKLDQDADPKLSLVFDINNTSLSNPQCVFWNFSLLDGVGGWDSNGCRVEKSETTGNVDCLCTHTTSFSVLMSPFLSEDPVLDYITYIGVAISMGSLILCLIIEIIIWKSMTKNDTSYMRHFSTVNLAASLLIADICFIVGAGIVKKEKDLPVKACSAVTFFMHFFYLALFFWMLLSALLLLYRTLVVFSRMSRSLMMAIAFIVGYGAPLLIAVITVAVTAGNDGYIHEAKACWLNWNKTKTLLAFVIPALTIVVINILVLIVVLYKMLKRGVGATAHTEEKHTMLVIARCVGILTPLFGLTWGFGIGTMMSTAKGIHIVFAILNSLQGFFILLFGTLLDNKIREAILGKLKLKNISSNFTVSTGASSNGRGIIHRFPRKYAYNVSDAVHSSTVPSSNSDTFKFIDT